MTLTDDPHLIVIEALTEAQRVGLADAHDQVVFTAFAFGRWLAAQEGVDEDEAEQMAADFAIWPGVYTCRRQQIFVRWAMVGYRSRIAAINAADANGGVAT